MKVSSFSQSESTRWLIRAKKRLLGEYKQISRTPIDNIFVNFEEDNFLEWHFLLIGLEVTPFEGGEYHGKLVFPGNYPFSPPSIRFITPNGRFKTHERVCFALSDFHPECWKPAFTVSVVLQGVYSFMMTETTEVVGSLIMDTAVVRSLARKSKDFNRKNKICTEMFRNQYTSNPDHSGPFSNADTDHTEILSNQSDEHSKLSKTTSNKIKTQNISTTNTFLEGKKLSSDPISYDISDLPQPANPETISDFGAIPGSKTDYKNSEVHQKGFSQSISQQHLPSETSSFSNNVHLNLAAEKKERILKEFEKLSKDPIDNIIVNYRQNEISDWHFKFIGLKETPFEGGEYHGKLEFPENYPFSPPQIQFITPNGRYKENEKISFELSDFNPKCWKPAYTVSAMLQGVFNFMMSETTDIVGSLNLKKNKIRKLARRSKEFNRKNLIFFELFHSTVSTDCVNISNSEEFTCSTKLSIEDSVLLNDSDISNIKLKFNDCNPVVSIEMPPKGDTRITLRRTASNPIFESKSPSPGKYSQSRLPLKSNTFESPEISPKFEESHRSKILSNYSENPTQYPQLDLSGHSPINNACQSTSQDKNTSLPVQDFRISETTKTDENISVEMYSYSMRENREHDKGYHKSSNNSKNLSTTNKSEAQNISKIIPKPEHLKCTTKNTQGKLTSTSKGNHTKTNTGKQSSSIFPNTAINSTCPMPNLSQTPNIDTQMKKLLSSNGGGSNFLYSANKYV